MNYFTAKSGSRFSLFQLAIIGLVTSTLLSSCLSTTSMQTGRTMGEGNLGFGGSAAYSSINDDSTTLSDGTGVLLEFFARYGINDKLDIGGRIGTGTYGLDGKYKLLGENDGKYAISAGLAGAYSRLDIESGSSSSSYSVVDFSIPVYASVHPTEWLGIYATPRYIFRRTKSDSDSSDASKESSSSYGTTLGLRIGKDNAFNMEYSLFKSNGFDGTLSQITFGMTFGIK